jgi:hypothetical protein
MKKILLNILLIFFLWGCTQENPFYGVEEEDKQGPSVNLE